MQYSMVMFMLPNMILELGQTKSVSVDLAVERGASRGFIARSDEWPIIASKIDRKNVLKVVVIPVFDP